MAETAITAVLSKIGELAVNEAKILLQVGDDIIILRDRLEWLQAFVRDADRKRRAGTDGLTRVWVRQTRDVAFDAEDALDDFFHEEVAGLKVHGCRRRWKTLRTYFTGFFTKIVVRHGLSDRMKIISNRLEHISLNQKEYQIVHTPSVVLSSSTTAIAAWRDDLENAKGFNYDAKTLLAMLYKGGTPKPMFISIVGESGAGKSTLARVIRRKIRDSRDVKVVWYNMEPGCSTENFLKEVHRLAKLELTAQEQADASSVEIGRKLYDVLNGRNFLFILGGISSKSMLNSMRVSLPVSGCQVMLLLDTENEDIAWHADTMNGVGICAVYLLTRLVEKRTRNLFFWKVLRKQEEESDDDEVDEDEEDEDDSEKEQAEKRNYGRLVHKITGGYPMAIVLLAGLLRFKEKPLQWNAVLQQLMSENNGTQQVQWGAVLQQLRSGNNGTQDASECLPNTQITNLSGGTRRAMEPVFWASFEDLHNDLRSCFLYFASYPTNSSHPADQLVRMWIGEGFIKPRRGNTMEEVGHDYLKELVLRCLVEVEEMKANGGIRLVRVHKSLMGFLESEAREAGFMEMHNIHDVVVPPSVRRLSVQSDNGKRYNITFASKKFPKLRSFICRIVINDDGQTTHQHDLEFLLSSRFLRVISVEGLSLSKLPEKIGDMIQLRYLRIDCRSLVVLPDSIARLLNLQTLDISNTDVKNITNDFWKIRTLRHVLASNLTLPSEIPIVEEGHHESGLQTLHGVKPVACKEWSKGNCPLDKMTGLLSLEMHGFQYSEEGGTAFEEALTNMRLLGHLKLQGDEIPLCVFTDPHLRSLETMELHGHVNWKDILPKSENINVVRDIIPENTNVVGEIVPENNSVMGDISGVDRPQARGAMAWGVRLKSFGNCCSSSTVATVAQAVGPGRGSGLPTPLGDIIPKENINVPANTVPKDNINVVAAVSNLILKLRPNLVQVKLNDINPVSKKMEDQLWEIIVGEKRATGGDGEGEGANLGEGGEQREGAAAAEDVAENGEGGEARVEGGGKWEVEARRGGAEGRTGGAEGIQGGGGQGERVEPRRGGPPEVGGRKGDGQEAGGAEKAEEEARGRAKGGVRPKGKMNLLKKGPPKKNKGVDTSRNQNAPKVLQSKMKHQNASKVLQSKMKHIKR